MGKMCYRCMAPTVEAGICTRCGEPELKADSNGDNALAPGTVLGKGRVTVGKKLGSGGFGVTYIAYDSKLNRRVALKEFMPNYLAVRQGVRITPKPNQEAQYEKAMNSFQKEARAMYELRAHPNIVHVISTFRENNTAYYTMEMLEGESLLSYLRKKKKIAADRVFRMLLPIMSALQYVHSKKIIHRDVSPDNIMLCEDRAHPGRIVPKLIDFGAAHVAIEGFSMSYPGVKKNGFSPLEQNWAGNYQGSWTDVYAFCATFYSAIVGSVPVSAADRAEADRDPLKPPEQMGAEITPEMSAVLMRGLKLKYQERIQTMDRLIREMTEAANRSGAGVTVAEGYTAQTKEPVRPAAKRVCAWLLERLIAVGAMLALTPDLLATVQKGSPERLLELITPTTLAIPGGIFLLDLLLLIAAGGTLGQLLFGLKTQGDDGSGNPSFGKALVYALCYSSFGWPVSLLCGIIWLVSGRNIGPLEGALSLMVSRRGEGAAGGLAAAGGISASVPAAAVHSVPENAGRVPPGQIPPPPKTPSGQGAPMKPGPSQVQPSGQPRRPSSQVPPKVSSGQAPKAPSAQVTPPGSGQSAVKTAALICQSAADSAAGLKGKAIQIRPGDTLGKNSSRATVNVPDQTVSGLHCSFAYNPQRGWTVKDENSTNGTYVNDIRLPSGGMGPIRNGFQLKVGKETFVFRAD